MVFGNSSFETSTSYSFNLVIPVFRVTRALKVKCDAEAKQQAASAAMKASRKQLQGQPSVAKHSVRRETSLTMRAAHHGGPASSALSPFITDDATGTPITPDPVRSGRISSTETSPLPPTSKDLEKLPGRSVLFAEPQPDSLTLFQEEQCRKGTFTSLDERSNSLYAELAQNLETHGPRSCDLLGGRRQRVSSFGLGSLDHLQLASRLSLNGKQQQRDEDPASASRIIDRARLNGYTQQVIDKPLGRVEGVSCGGGQGRRFSSLSGYTTLDAWNSAREGGNLKPAVALGLAPDLDYGGQRMAEASSQRAGRRSSVNLQPLTSRLLSNRPNSDTGGPPGSVSPHHSGGLPRSHLAPVAGRRSEANSSAQSGRKTSSSSNKLEHILQSWDENQAY